MVRDEVNESSNSKIDCNDIAIRFNHRSFTFLQRSSENLNVLMQWYFNGDADFIIYLWRLATVNEA